MRLHCFFRNSKALSTTIRRRNVISCPNYDSWTQVVENVQDRGRKFLPATGGCGYVDLDHIELPLPEQTSAYGFVAATHASIRILQEAQSEANAKLREGLRLQVLANNSDGKNHAFGSHLNVLLSRKTFNDSSSLSYASHALPSLLLNLKHCLYWAGESWI